MDSGVVFSPTSRSTYGFWMQSVDDGRTGSIRIVGGFLIGYMMDMFFYIPYFVGYSCNHIM
jgi:hypothetical protein